MAFQGLCHLRIFERLSSDDLIKIVSIQVDILTRRLGDKNILLEVSGKAKDALARLGYDPLYGARPLKRVIQKQLQDPIALKLLRGQLKEGQKITVDAQKDNLIFAIA